MNEPSFRVSLVVPGSRVVTVGNEVYAMSPTVLRTIVEVVAGMALDMDYTGDYTGDLEKTLAKVILAGGVFPPQPTLVSADEGPNAIPFQSFDHPVRVTVEGDRPEWPYDPEFGEPLDEVDPAVELGELPVAEQAPRVHRRSMQDFPRPTNPEEE